MLLGFPLLFITFIMELHMVVFSGILSHKYLPNCGITIPLSINLFQILINSF